MPRLVALLATLLLVAPPVSAAPRELGPRGVAPTSNYVDRTHVAFAGGRFLTVWNESMGSIGNYVMGALSDASGKRISPVAFPILQTMGDQMLQLVGTGDSFALFTVDGSGSKTKLTDIDTEGRVIRTRELALRQHIRFHAAWNGTHFLVALQHPAGIEYSAEALLLERDGTVVRGDLDINDRTHGFHVTTAGDAFAVFGTSWEHVTAYRITATGVAATQIETERNRHTPIAAGAPNGDIVGVWSAVADDGNSNEIRSVRVTRDGTAGAVHTLFASRDIAGALHVQRVDNGYILIYIALDPTAGLALWQVRLREDGSADGAPSRLALAGGHSEMRAAASDATILLVYGVHSAWPATVESLPLSFNGTTSARETLSLSRTQQMQPALAAGPGRYLAAWTDRVHTAAFLRAATLASDGEPLEDRIVTPAFLATQDVAWNGTEYLVIATRDNRLLSMRVDADGNPMDAEPLILGDTLTSAFNRHASVTWAGDRWVVVWTDRQDSLLFASISRSNTLQEFRTLPIPKRDPSLQLSFWAHAVAFDGSALLLAWTESQTPPCTQIPTCGPFPDPRTFAARMTRSGTLGELVELPLAYTLSAASSRSESVVLGDGIVTILDKAATPRVLASRTLMNWDNIAGDVTWDGETYAVALRFAGFRWHVSVTHLDRNANIIMQRGADTLAPDMLMPPSIAALTPYASIVAIHEGSAADGVRAVVYPETEMAPLPAAPVAPANVHVRPLDGTRFEVTWDAAPRAELYLVEGRTYGGAWIRLELVPADAPLRVTTSYFQVRVRAFNRGGTSADSYPAVQPRRRSARP